MIKKSFLLIILIGQTFLWTGSAYMSVLYKLYTFYDPIQATVLTEGLYYVVQALGIAAFALFLRKRRLSAGSKIFAVIILIMTGIFTAVSLLSDNKVIVTISGIFMNFCIGIISGTYITRLASDIPQQCRGRVFGFAYAIGSVGTWLLSLPLNGNLLKSDASIFVFAVLIVISIILTRFLNPFSSENDDCQTDAVHIDKKLIVLALFIPFVFSLTNGIGSFMTDVDLSKVINLALNRAFYAVGLIAAGYFNDKNRRFGAVCCAIALIFPFAALSLRNEIEISVLLSILSYIFNGFFSVYRVVLFADLAGKKPSLLFIAVFGLMSGRVGDSLGTLFGAIMGSSQIALTSLTAIAFIASMLLFFKLYHKLYVPRLSEKQNTEELLDAYETRYKFTARQCEIFRLVVKGCSNSEISSEMYLAESTVKFHMKNILKQTGKSNRTELVSHFKSGKFL